MTILTFFFLVCFLALRSIVTATHPSTYRVGDSVKLRVNKLTSLQTLFPLSHYHVPLCQPVQGIKGTKQHLGQHFTGDEIRNSPYQQLLLGTDLYCETLCVSHLGRAEQRSAPLASANHMVQAIHQGFFQNWLIEGNYGLPAAWRDEDANYVTTKYVGGFPLGFVGKEDKRAYVYNHVNLMIYYHPMKDHDHEHSDEALLDAKEEYRIVRFIVQPFSIKHKFDISDEGPIVMKTPTASCQPRATEHTNFAQLYQMAHVKPQLAHGLVLFTYDVIWIQDMDIHWSDRWDVYLMNDSAKNYWFSTLVSLTLITVLSSMIVTLLSNNLRRDFNRYNKVATDEEKEEALEEYGWKLVHGDVFRPPNKPMTLAVGLGTGAQLLTTSIICLTLGMFGVIQPMHRGKMVMAQLVCFSLAGSINGYVTGHAYRIMGGTTWKTAGLAAALGYSGLAFVVFFIASSMANKMQSTMRVPFEGLVTIVGLWLLVCAPLSFWCTCFGFYRPVPEFPTRTNPSPRPIPIQPWYTSWILNLLIAGIFPFVPCFFEVYDTLCVLWLDAYDPFYVFFFFIALCALLLSIELTVLLCYFQLVREDYRWWWRSFGTGGALAVYIFGYVVYYHAQHLQAANHLASWFLYYGYMLVACLGLACGAGFTGFVAALGFIRAIFGSVKID